jgi:type I restriction enzyme S subunit
MTTEFQTYSKYKNSDVEWTQRFPSEWSVQRVKTIFHLVKRPIRESDDIVTAFRDGMVTLRKNRKEDGFTIALQESGYQGIRKGDLVISGMDGFAGAIGISDSDGKSTPVYSVCVPNSGESFSPYYAYLLRTLAITGYISILARGIRERSTEFKWNIIGDIRLLLPPIETQQRIADFLDEKKKVIDRLIEKKEQLIKLLRENRAALITRTVTKGLDPHAKLKPSGVEWVGDIPVGWNDRKLKYVSKIDTGGIFGDEMIGDVEAKLVTTGQLSMSGEWYLDEMENKFFSKVEYSKFKNVLGDIVVVKSSGSSTNIITGKAGFVSEKEAGTVFGNFLLRVRALDIMIPKYLYYFLTSNITRQRIELMCSSTTYPNLKVWEYVSALILLPPKYSQQKIVAFLDTETIKIDRTAVLIESQMEKLKEYRSSLIYSAVTGKIKI